MMMMMMRVSVTSLLLILSIFCSAASARAHRPKAGGHLAADEIKDEINVIKRVSEPRKPALVAALVSNCVPLLIQQNVSGFSFFNRSWSEFKNGFQDSVGNYWLGNKLLSQLTLRNRYKLRFDLQSRSNTSNWYWAEYSTFRVLSETYNYEVQVAGYSGNAGYDAFGYHNGMMFSTYDRDNDRSSRNCAVIWGGGFWYKACHRCGVNMARDFGWKLLRGGNRLQSTRMWLQCQ